MILRSGLVLTTSALLVVALPSAGNADPGGKGGGKPVAGARSLGDPLLPQIGNGGYDVKHYRIQLDYDPATNSFTSAKTTIRAKATQTLKEFSLDFQDLDVASVTVRGEASAWGEPPGGSATRSRAGPAGLYHPAAARATARSSSRVYGADTSRRPIVADVVGVIGNRLRR